MSWLLLFVSCRVTWDAFLTIQFELALIPSFLLVFFLINIEHHGFCDICTEENIFQGGKVGNLGRLGTRHHWWCFKHNLKRVTKDTTFKSSVSSTPYWSLRHFCNSSSSGDDVWAQIHMDWWKHMPRLCSIPFGRRKKNFYVSLVDIFFSFSRIQVNHF